MLANDNRDDPVRIGLSTYRESARWGVWDESADLLPTSYANSVTEAGGVALLLPPGPVNAVSAVLDGLHGLVIAGGADVDPARYGRPRDPRTGSARPDRDDWELALVAAALARELPLLAICRGLQVLNVALGGGLIQHLPDQLGTELHCPSTGVHGRHRIAVAERGLLASVMRSGTEVATYHHQAIETLGTGLSATGWAEDGTIEAVEGGGRGWLVGVQWHPEVHDGAALFAAFVRAARDYREGSAR